MENIFSSFHMSWDSFLVGISQITMECRMQDIPILDSLEITQVTWMIFVGSIHLKESVFLLSVQDETPSTRSLTVRLSRSSLGVTVTLLLA